MPDIDDMDLMFDRPINGLVDMADDLLVLLGDIILNINDDQCLFCILSPPERYFNELLLNDPENILAQLRIGIGSPQSRVIGMGGAADGEDAGPAGGTRGACPDAPRSA